MSSVVEKVRHEIVLAAGVAVGVLNYVLTNGGVLSAIIPLVVSVLTRTQTSPVVYVENLLALIGELRSRKASPPAAK